MSLSIANALDVFERLWPSSGAEAWDNPGLAVGSPTSDVTKVLVTVDVTPDVVAEALEKGAELVLSHHPVIFKPLKTLAGQSAAERTLTAALSGDIALFSAHTNADHVNGGVSDSLALAIGLVNCVPLDHESGHGRFGWLSQSLSLLEFVTALSEGLPQTSQGLLVQGEPDMEIQKVAVLAGSGDSFLEIAAQTTADVFVTSDLRHHRALDFKSGQQSRPQALINISHWAAERVWVDQAVAQLVHEMPELEFIPSSINTDPWDFSIKR